MVLFSFRHSVKTFSEKRTAGSRVAKAGQTAAHLRYITRPHAARTVLRERLTGLTDSATAKNAEDAAQQRKGRVCERFIVALPREATPEQREALAQAFAEKLTCGVAGYVAAVHDKQGNDKQNPHFHLVAFDVMVKSGGRGRPKSTLGMARKQAIETTAKMWADLHNDMITRWGYGPESTISHLSLKNQGSDRIPTIHEGPAARRLSSGGKTPKGKEKWRGIDEGHSRAEANKIIREINQAKEEINEREYRLGRHDDEGGAQRDRRGDECRAGGRRSGQGAGNPAPPFAATLGAQESARNTGARGKLPPFAADPNRRQRPGRSGSQFPLTRLGLRRRAGRRYGVRRIYRELIWLRDTLRARLLPIDGQSRLRPEPINAAEARAAPERMKSQHDHERDR
ncbi:hypothetical protein FHY64_03525 [Pelagovum pacificum]|uniref:MobA/MobL protein domain-containing protein n=1 Tax=Pelagovum pacificum TaxID=2588711 RepID=A0A5C5GC50_9RHOB|nr:MobA/MobL family protein [Pelagovum pacificum]TNY32375.1 hypothetical protein FHY64_03525 [Pelagovum pacificum]